MLIHSSQYIPNAKVNFDKAIQELKNRNFFWAIQIQLIHQQELFSIQYAVPNSKKGEYYVGFGYL